MSPEIAAVVGLVGALTQLGSIVLILLLMLLLSREQPGVAHLRRWTQAWFVFAIAIGAVALRYSQLGPWNLWHRGERDGVVRLLYATYIAGKFWYIALLVVGVQLFRTPEARVPSTLLLGLASVVAGTAAVAAVSPLDQLMILQSAVAVPAFAWCALMLAGRHRHRPSTGALLLSAAFAAHGVLWLGYAVAYLSTTFALHAEPFLIQRYNSYIDTILQTLLVYGMVALQMERATHESRDAHAKLQDAHTELRRAAMFDPLSGALSRQAYASGFGLDAAMKVGGIVAAIDIDNLKPINDTLGHSGGDALLRHVAQTVSHAIRADDALYRWGGDEFLLILPGADHRSASAILDRALAAAATLTYTGIVVPVSVSYGCAPYASRNTLEESISAADRAMYDVKSARKMSRTTSPTGMAAVSDSGPSYGPGSGFLDSA